MQKRILVLFLLAAASLQAQNVQKDIALGKQYSEYVESAIGIYDNQELTAYIKAVGDKLTAQMDEPLFDYSYTILATPEPNAFSIPGGHLYITTGMFPFLESEDELACIMAHEIIHANNRHAIKSNRRGIIPGILQIPGAIIGAVVDENIGNALQSPFQHLGMLTHASYNRRQEREADAEGVEMAAKAGYNPDALKSILSRVGTYGELVSGETEIKSAYASHPMTAERVAKIDKIQPKLKKGERSYLAKNFLEMFDGSLAGSDPNRGVFIAETYYNPADSFKLVFPEGWEGGFLKNTIYAANDETEEFMRIIFRKSEDNPTQAAHEFLEQLNPIAREYILGSKPVTVDGKNGYIIAFKEEYDGGAYYGFKTWLRHDSLLFSFLAVSQDKDLSEMEEVPYSLSALTSEDRGGIEFPTLRLVEARKDETIRSLIERTKTDLTEKLILLINQKAAEESFQEGEKVKVVVKEKL